MPARALAPSSCCTPRRARARRRSPDAVSYDPSAVLESRAARFPFIKILESFDFTYQPSIDKKQIQTLSTLGVQRDW
jgi:IstB-like ATP binding protein